MTTKSILITTLTLALTILSCKKEKPEPNAPKSGEENPVGDTISTGNTNIGFRVCAGGPSIKQVYFKNMDSIVLRKLEQNPQIYEYTELNKITILPSDFNIGYGNNGNNPLEFTSSYIKQDVLNPIGHISYGTDRVEMSIYLSVPLNYIVAPFYGQPSKTGSTYRFSPTNMSDAPCLTSISTYFSKLSVGDDSNRCKLVGIN